MTEQSDQQYPISLNSKNIEYEESKSNSIRQKNSFFAKINKDLINKKVSSREKDKIFQNQIIQKQTNDGQQRKIQYERIHRLKELLNFNDSVRMNFINQNLDAMLVNFRIKQNKSSKHKQIKIVPMSTSNIQNYKNHSNSSQTIICDSSFSVQKNHSLSLQNKNCKSNQLQVQPQEDNNFNTIHIKNISLKKQKQLNIEQGNQIRKRRKLSRQKIILQQKKSSRSYEKYKKANLFCKCQQKQHTKEKNIYFPVISQIQHIPQIKFKAKDSCNTQRKFNDNKNSRGSFFSKHYQSRVRKNNQIQLIQSSNTKYDLKQKARKTEKRINEIKFKKRQTSLIDFVY